MQSLGDSTYVLTQPYPYKGTPAERRRVLPEALLCLPLIQHVRQFMALGNTLPDAMRKAVTVSGENNYDRSAIAPVISWATTAQVLDLNVRVEKLVAAAVVTKETRHAEREHERVAFISHSTKDKSFARRLAGCLCSMINFPVDRVSLTNHLI